MRVVSGSCKGRRLKAVPGMNTRPTSDKIKESIFNMIGPYFQEGLGLDLFAGSGGLGIEALSRGLDKLVFVDRDKAAINTIKANLNLCKFTDQAEVYRNDADRALKALQKRKIKFDFVFLDPPYNKGILSKLLEKIQDYELLSETALVVIEHESELRFADEIGGLKKIRSEDYGTIAVTIFTIN